ncbi:MAG: hypothetical protein EA416_03695 [Trueperaceae bacterium]|nr:MAG: hypothetical protein EA416_03695 [Trueperaceae bacterium]
MSVPQFKVITSNSLELFEERLNDFVEQMNRDDIIVDVKFATTALSSTVEFSALIQYQTTETWS